MVHNSIQNHLLLLRPGSPRTCCIAADAFLTLREPDLALRVAARGVAAAQAQGQREPYHTAKLHLLAARAMGHGGMGGPAVPVAALEDVRQEGGTLIERGGSRSQRPLK